MFNMKIKTVKDFGKYYLVNDSIDIPKDEKNKDYIEIQEWLSKGGSLTEKHTDSELRAEITVLIKREAARRIDEAYPEWQQRNYMAAVAEIHNKEIVAMKAVPFIAQYQLTADELQTVKDAEACKLAITAIRTKSNELENSLDSMTLDQLKAFDPSDDSNWV